MKVHLRFASYGLLMVVFAGCNAATGPVIPTGELTPEQQAKVRAEDKQVEDEESQGSANKQ